MKKDFKNNENYFPNRGDDYCRVCGADVNFFSGIFDVWKFDKRMWRFG